MRRSLGPICCRCWKELQWNVSPPVSSRCRFPFVVLLTSPKPQPLLSRHTVRVCSLCRSFIVRFIWELALGSSSSCPFAWSWIFHNMRGRRIAKRWPSLTVFWFFSSAGCSMWEASAPRERSGSTVLRGWRPSSSASRLARMTWSWLRMRRWWEGRIYPCTPAFIRSDYIYRHRKSAL